MAMNIQEEYGRSEEDDTHDVVIVGAGISGSAAAILLGRLGLKILVLEKKLSSDEYKANCTTFIQASALPVIRGLGIQEELEKEGAVRNSALFWTEFGWIVDRLQRDKAYGHGYSVQRKKLDPLLRRKAVEVGNVTIRLGATLDSLVESEDGNIVGIGYLGADGIRRESHAQLVILADGRNSRGADLASVPTVRRENNRFVYFAYYKNMPLKTGKTAQFWQRDRDMGFAYPFDDDLTMLCCFVTHDQYENWRGDKFAALESFFDDLPCAPDKSQALRASRMLGMRRLDDYKRPAVHQNLALIGDACMSCDPMSGVGCGFALQSAQWLTECVGDALVRRDDLRPSLSAYRRKHRKMLAGHEFFIKDNATGRPMSFLEKLISRAAVADAKVAHRLHLFIGRVISWKAFLTPPMLLRILTSNVTYARRKDELRAHEPI
ncbi:NAD(P)/FAD-dependent oxidoreductase [Saliniramus fredricksonii]|uniref:Dehydrogenase (Flavoprotein) n=1 Tax=Saliniramus fredricksonii TaxID=1653334 RepID=A0ABY0K3I2_9HYPH|nr:NAD(P)/FAD-dependent oxidoreductase [Saliniramus fredricksonii]SCC77994.1 Dehydrogenase (flavoprotein) [Saliniramus fredricksonii]